LKFDSFIGSIADITQFEMSSALEQFKIDLADDLDRTIRDLKQKTNVRLQQLEKEITKEQETLKVDAMLGRLLSGTVVFIDSEAEATFKLLEQKLAIVFPGDEAKRVLKFHLNLTFLGQVTAKSFFDKKVEWDDELNDLSLDKLAVWDYVNGNESIVREIKDDLSEEEAKKAAVYQEFLGDMERMILKIYDKEITGSMEETEPDDVAYGDWDVAPRGYYTREKEVFACCLINFPSWTVIHGENPSYKPLLELHA
jgi:hypothetical protein